MDNHRAEAEAEAGRTLCIIHIASQQDARVLSERQGLFMRVPGLSLRCLCLPEQLTM